MAEAITPLDISDAPELLRLAEEVRRSGRPRLLRHAKQDLAILAPIGRTTSRGGRKSKPGTAADDAAFLASAGGWRGNVDVPAFLKANEDSRRRSVSRSSPEL